MRVLMFGWEFPPYNSGGLGVACFGLTKALSGQGVDVLFVLPRKADYKSDFMEMAFADVTANVEVAGIDSLLTPYSTSQSYLSELDRSGANAGRYGHTLMQEVSRYADKAVSIAKKNNFDVIHAHDWLAALAGAKAKEATGKPLVLHIHATEFDRTGGTSVNHQVYSIEKAGMEAADCIVAVSKYTKDLIADKYGIDPNKIQVIHNGADMDEFQQNIEPNETLQMFKDKGYKIALFLGRFTIQKGPDYFLEAARRVLTANPKILFVMVGSGDMENMILEKAAAMGISDKIMFPGFLRGEEKHSVYSAADVFVMSSVSEPFGLVALEAIGNGVPVIVSKQSGVSEVIQHSLKVDFWDVTLMADMILQATGNKTLSESLKKNSLKEAKSLTWDKAAKKVKQTYNSLASNFPMTA